jgi:xanthine dehydrogenase accessory factor
VNSSAELAASQRAELAASLRADRVAYVHARVVLAERPTSAKPGDEALVLPDGTMEGFVGGTCAASTVRAQALALLDAGGTMLLRITPEPEPGRPGTTTVHNPCLSGGTLELFLEAVVPAPLVVVTGDTPIARAVVALAGPLGWTATRWVAESGGVDAPALPADTAAVVVASHGRDEDEVLRAALRAGVPYIGLVASRKRGDAVLAALGADDRQRGAIRTPAGLDIGARTPEEVALSILAEMVSVRPRPSARPLGDAPGPSVEQAVDPVCGMTVAVVDSSLHLDHGGARVWFCGSGCLRAFAADPGAYGARA